MLNISQLVHSVQVLGGDFLGLTAGQETDTWYSWWDSSSKSSYGEESNLLWVSLNLGLGTGGDHVWLEEHTLKDNVLGDQFVHDGVEYLLGNSGASLDVMGTVREDLWLDDWHETSMLADLSISSQRVGSLGDGNFRWASIVGDLQDSSPLGESGSHFVVLLGSLRKAIQSHGDSLISGTLDDGNTSINLDSSENTLVSEDLGQWGSIGGVLSDSLVVHDSTTDVLVETLGGVKELSVVISVLLGVLDIDCLESLSAGSVGLIGSQDTFAWGGEELGIGHELFGEFVTLIFENWVQMVNIVILLLEEDLVHVVLRSFHLSLTGDGGLSHHNNISSGV